MNKLENVDCDLCGQNDTVDLYATRQYSNSLIGKVDIKLVMCKNCNFIYQNPQLTSPILEKHYEHNSSGDIFRVTKGNTRAGFLLQERQKFIYDSLPLANIKSICDVGGGTGVLLSSLELSSSINKYLIEPSSAIDKCNDPSIIKIKKRVEDIAKQKTLKFDLLMCISALEHLKAPSSILNTFNKLINESGYILIEVPNTLKPYNTFAEYFSYEHVNHFTYETLLSFLKKSNFYPVKIDESKHFHTIRVLAKKQNEKYTHKSLIEFFDKYQKEKNSFSKTIIDKMELFFDTKQTKSFCIYGAGDHTRFLLEQFDCLGSIDYFIDSDPKKWGKKFYDKKIISPNNILSLDIKNILISSHDFEKEIFTNIKEIAKHVNVMTIYGDYK